MKLTRSQKAQTNFGKADVTPYDGRTNWYAGGSAIGEECAEFMRCVVGKEVTQSKNNAKIRDLRNAIKDYKSCDDSLFEGDTKTRLIKAKEDKIAELRKEIEDCDAYEYVDRDFALYNDYYSGDPKRWGGIAVQLYFATYGIKIGSRDLEAVCEALGSTGFERAGRTRSHVLTGKMNICGRDFKDFITTFYGKLADMLVSKGALSPMAFPEEIRDRYTRKTKGAKSAK